MAAWQVGNGRDTVAFLIALYDAAEFTSHGNSGRSAAPHTTGCSPARGGHRLTSVPACFERYTRFVNDSPDAYGPTNRPSPPANRYEPIPTYFSSSSSTVI